MIFNISFSSFDTVFPCPNKTNWNVSIWFTSGLSYPILHSFRVFQPRSQPLTLMSGSLAPQTGCPIYPILLLPFSMSVMKLKVGKHSQILLQISFTSQPVSSTFKQARPIAAFWLFPLPSMPFIFLTTFEQPQEACLLVQDPRVPSLKSHCIYREHLAVLT